MKKQPTLTSIFDQNSLDDSSSLNKAFSLQLACAKIGFDWDSLGPVSEKVTEELEEVLEEALQVSPDQSRIDDEIGDLLFAVVNLARHLDCDPQNALSLANQKFERRFRALELKAQQLDKPLTQMSLDEMDDLWKQVKVEQNN